MAKLSSIEKNNTRKKIVARSAKKRNALRDKSKDSNLTYEERADARLALQKMKRNTIADRVRNRCELSGRPRGNLRKFKLSRIAFRKLANDGLIPGVTKASW